METTSAAVGLPKRPAFTTTHWSIVQAARGDGCEADSALEDLCRIYWHPLYAYVRRRGHDAPDAQDLTQAFFARLLESDFLQGVDRSKGKFRSFLLAALEHFLAKEWRRANAIKRGRGMKFLSLDDDSMEGQYCQVASGDLTPEKLFEQQWAMTLLEHTVARLRDEFVGAGRKALFDELKIFLTGEKQVGRYAELAAKLCTTEAALKMGISRMRRRYSELLREEIARTVRGPEEVEEELRALFAVLK